MGSESWNHGGLVADAAERVHLSNRTQALLMAMCERAPVHEWTSVSAPIFRKLWGAGIRRFEFFLLACNGDCRPDGFEIAEGRHLPPPPDRERAALRLAHESDQAGTWFLEKWPTFRQLWRTGLRDGDALRHELSRIAATADELAGQVLTGMDAHPDAREAEKLARYLFPTVRTARYVRFVLDRDYDDDPAGIKEADDDAEEIVALIRALEAGKSTVEIKVAAIRKMTSDRHLAVVGART